MTELENYAILLQLNLLTETAIAWNEIYEHGTL